MRQCSDYEVELSALFDGESDPATALELLEHVASCSSCGFFVRELRSVQATVDAVFAAPEQQPQAAPLPQRRPRLSFVPRWAWGMAAALVVAVGVWFGADVTFASDTTISQSDNELVIRLEEDKGRMSEARFVSLVAELLRADRRYQNQMYAVLDDLNQGEVPAELPRLDGGRDSRESAAAQRSARSSPAASVLN